MSTLVPVWLAGPASTITGLHSGDDPAQLRFRTWAQVRDDATQRAAAAPTSAPPAHAP